MSRKPSGKGQTNMASGASGKPAVTMPKGGGGRDAGAVGGATTAAHSIVMGITKNFSSKAKSTGAPGPNNQEKTGVPSFPKGAYALVNPAHGAQPDKMFKAFARGNSSKGK